MNLPKRVTIELTNRCNRACDGCPRNKTAYPLGDMKWKLFESIVGQLPSSTVIVPFFRGETLLHPRFNVFLEKLGKFENVQLSTNGDLLNQEKEKAILNTCSFVSISLHSFVYPSKIHNGILSFLYEAGGNGVTTQVSILETLVPDGEKEPFVSAWLQHTDKVRVYVEHSHNGFGDVHQKYRKVKESKLLCEKPFNEMVVYWDGKVGLCNHDWDNSHSLGDLCTETIPDVWNGHKYRQLRMTHRVGLRKTIRSCKNCDYWMTSYLPKKMFGELYT